MAKAWLHRELNKETDIDQSGYELDNAESRRKLRWLTTTGKGQRGF
jgi:hypothetical protein